MKTLALIPARGGSKGVPRKNLYPLAGKPLIAHTIEQACQARLVNRVIVSTDDPEIAAVSESYGAEIIWRPVDISGDTATSESALLHALCLMADTESYQPDLLVFLQCTSPLRRPVDIDNAIQTLSEQNADSLVSVVPSHDFLWVFSEGQAKSLNYDYRCRPRRQDRQPEYRENGSIYILKPWVLYELNNRLGGLIVLYPMDIVSSIDIDTLEDFSWCEWKLSHSYNHFATDRPVSMNIKSKSKST
ncbi:MAG: acylneuraminate cytidylyltransferase family protein [Anaerolineae bacterium]|nr:acylneuraminate cytidylyltransferase family protein [Anaerolineae bacterium]